MVSAEPQPTHRSTTAHVRTWARADKNQGEFKMERRKFLIGAGGAAVGSSALIGSGAFSSVEARRTSTVELVEDENAYLALTVEDEAYADTDGDGRLELDYTDNEEDGKGLNQASRTQFDAVWGIENQGPETVTVFLDGVQTEKPYQGDNEDVPHQVEAGRIQAPAEGAGNDAPDSDNLWDDPIDLETGEKVKVGKIMQPMEGTGTGEWEDDFAVCAFADDMTRDFESGDNHVERDFGEPPAIGGDEDTRDDD